MHNMGIVIGFITWIFGLFAASQILYPIFTVLPRLSKLKKAGKLEEDYQLSRVFITPLLWLAISAGAYFAVRAFSPDSVGAFLGAYALAAGIIIIQIPMRNPDIFSDFLGSYGRHIKGGYEEHMKGKTKGGLLSWVLNAHSREPYLISTAQEIGKDYWSATIINGRSNISRSPEMVLSVIRNTQEEAHEAHHELVELALNTPEDEWLENAPPPMPDELSTDAKATLSAHGVRS